MAQPPPTLIHLSNRFTLHRNPQHGSLFTAISATPHLSFNLFVNSETFATKVVSRRPSVLVEGELGFFHSTETRFDLGWQ
jgi:hypothetical protein